jgi:hypothetical protein
MVKNLPTVERSTKIRFGKNVPDSDVQAENTIIFNASNTLVTTPNSGSIYMSPVRFREDFTDTNIVLMMYNRATGELSESGESASNLVGGQTLEATTLRGNTTSNTVQFTNLDTSLVTNGYVGIVNTQPLHTLSVGSNLYVSDTGANVLVVAGGVSIDGNLVVSGGVTTISSQNLTVDDGIIELGRNNVSGDSTLDLGLIMSRPTSNITVGFLESSEEIVLAYTQSSADNATITPLSSQDINVHVYGRLYTEANVGVLNTDPVHTLDVGSNLYVDEFGSNILVVSGNTNVTGDLTVDTDTLYVDSVSDRVGIKTTEPQVELHVVGNAYVSSNMTVDGDLTIDTNTLHVNAATDKVGVKTTSPDAELHVVGNAYVSSNLTVDNDTFHVDAVNDSIGLGTVNPDANLHVVGNVYVSSDLTVDTDTLHVDAEDKSIGLGTVNPDANLHVVGNVYVSSNLTVDEDTFHVDAENDSVGVGTVNPQANLHIVGNVYVSSNLTVDEDTLHVDATTHSVGVETKSPQANLHVVGNVYVSSNLTVDDDTLHVDATTNSVGIETKNPTSNLHVVGNVYVSSNITTDGTLTLNHPTTALITDLTANVEVKVDQLYNVNLNAQVADQLLVYDGTDWKNEYPLHTYIRIRNDAGTDLSRGDAVYVTGAHNQNVVNVGLARADSPSTMPAIGIVNDATITQGGLGIAVAYGRAQSVNTLGFIEGETVYVSNVVAGGLSNVKPFYTDTVPDSIQNVGVVVKVGETNGTIFVTGIGRANDVPNAQIVLDEGDINWVYVNDVNNDFKKIEPSNLLTQLQTLEQVSAAGNTTSNIMSFTNSTTSIVTSSNAIVGGNISVADLTDPLKKHLPMVDSDGFFEKSPVYVEKSSGKYVITASEAEFLGNITLSGNTTILSSESVTISDRIFGVAANNSASQLDSGFMIEHQDGDPLEYANVAIIYHADEHRFSISYTQNTFTDNHIIHYEDADHRMLLDFYGNVEVRHDLIVEENMNVVGTSLLSGDLTVGGASNLFVDVSTSNVGINEGTPLRNLDVNGDMRVQDTTDTSSTSGGALVVLGGLGVASNIHSTNVYAASHVGVGTVAATRPVHVMATSAGGIYVNGDGNDARVTLEATGVTADPVTSFTVNGGESFSVGIDNSINDTFNISNHASDVGTNARLTMTPAGITTLTNTTDATSKTTGSLVLGGGVGIAKNVYVGANAYVTGGLITNVGQVAKKTYSYSGDLATGTTTTDGKITLTFTNHTFYAKIMAQLIESDAEVSTLVIECAGGHWTGGTPLTVAKGTHNMFGDTNNTNPWDVTITFGTNTVSFQPSTAMADDGHYNVFVEYTSQHADGKLQTLTEGTTERINWGY